MFSRWLVSLCVSLLASHVADAQEPAPLSEDARLAVMAQQQLQCLVFAVYAHPGTATEEELQTLLGGVISNLKTFVQRARSEDFQGKSRIPVYMYIDGILALGSEDFAAGRVYQRVWDHEADLLTTYSGLFETDFDEPSRHGEYIPVEQWPDRGSAMFARNGCRSVVSGELQCIERHGCQPQID